MGPLAGFKIVEMAGIGPAPMCGMLLADLGATVLRVDRQEPSGLGLPGDARFSIMNRSRHAIAVDLKKSEGVGLVLRLVAAADGLIEGFRPGVMERLGLGPDPCLARNPKLVYGRMTGWGQDGPLAQAAGHDHQLHRAGRSAAFDRPRRAAADAALEPGRRFRRRRALSRFRLGLRHARGATLGQGTGGRRGHGRWRRLADDHLLCPPCRRQLHRAARRERARQRRLLLRRL